MPYKLTVNGRPATVDAPADMPLLWVIRDVLNLRGTKYGCGIGQCGACTVHIGGRAVRSCQTPISAAENAKITTIEGLSPDGSHPVQLAWADLDVQAAPDASRSESTRLNSSHLGISYAVFCLKKKKKS